MYGYMSTIGAALEPLYETMLRDSPVLRLQVAVERAKAEMRELMGYQIFGERDLVFHLIPPCGVPRLPKLFGLAFATAYAITEDGHDAMDAVAKALLNMVGHPTTPDNFEAYFLRAVRHAALDLVRQRQHRRKNEFAECEGAFEALRNSFELHDIALAMDVRSAVDAMEWPCREVADLHYLQGYTRPEIAVLMKRSVATINNWLHSARSQLRASLTDYKGTRRITSLNLTPPSSTRSVTVCAAHRREAAPRADEGELAAR